MPNTWMRRNSRRMPQLVTKSKKKRPQNHLQPLLKKLLNQIPIKMFNKSTTVKNIINLDALRITPECNMTILPESTHGEQSKKKTLLTGSMITTSGTLTSKNGRAMPQMDITKTLIQFQMSLISSTLGSHI